MKSINKSTKYIFFGIITFILMFNVFIPLAKADFFDDFVDFFDPTQPCNFIDPFGVFSNCDDEPAPIPAPANVNTQIPNPTVSISANPLSIPYNGASMISWNSSNATSCSTSGGSNGWSGSKSTSGTFYTGALINTTTHYITCSNSTGSANDSVTINVRPQVQTCQDTSATNYGGALPCAYYIQVCQNPSATNYGGALPCTFVQTCQDTNATNYGWALPCAYIQVCQDASAINYHGVLPCRYQNNYQTNTSVSISADRTNIAYNESTIVRWYPNNATYCTGSGGANGWAGTRNTFSSSFNTGPLLSTTTYTISCSNYNNNYGNYNNSDTRSVTVIVGNQTQTRNSLTATTTGATRISNTSAQLNSLITNSGNDLANSWFEWGRTMNLGNKTTTTPVGALPSVVHADTLSGLSSGTTYYFRAVAENSLWRNIGSILSFTTSGQNTVVIKEPVVNNKAPLTSLVLISSSIDRNQPIIPTIDNTRPHPGDEINYTVNYQNIGTGAITDLALQIALPKEVSYVFSNGNNPTIFGNTLIFNLGTLKANGQSSVTTKVRVQENTPAGTILNFPAILSYVNPASQPQSVSANISAQVWSAPVVNEKVTAPLEASAVGAGFLPVNMFGWLLLVILVLLLVLLGKYLYRDFSNKKVEHSPEHI